jgi:hypothetical protein
MGGEPPDAIDSGYRTASGTCAVSLEPTGARLDGRRDVSVDADALEHFHMSLAQLLDALTGSATLEPTLGLDGRGSFAITITLDHGKGNIEGFLATGYYEARLSFAGYEIDQSYLQETLRQFGSVLADR